MLSLEVRQETAIIGRGHEPDFNPLKRTDDGRLKHSSHYTRGNSSNRIRVAIILEVPPEVGNEVYIEWPSICAFAHDSCTVDSEPRVESFKAFPFVNLADCLANTDIL